MLLVEEAAAAGNGTFCIDREQSARAEGARAADDLGQRPGYAVPRFAVDSPARCFDAAAAASHGTCCIDPGSASARARPAML
jgi:hypothetical protein